MVLYKHIFTVFALVGCGFKDLTPVMSIPVLDVRETVDGNLISDSFHQPTQSPDPGIGTNITEPTPDVTTGDETENEYSYVAAVLEYAPNTDGDGGLDIIISNAQAYIVFALEAKNSGADIIVFPEYGLTGTGLPMIPDEIMPYTQNVPDPKDALVPCDFPANDTRTQGLRLLSCAARDLQLYLVVDLAELATCDDCLTGHHFYNTQVVFNRQGTLIARYRKRNLFGEFQLRPGPEEVDTAIFTTDFGVTFALQVCFDILYEYPGVVSVIERGVKHVAMSTAWMDQLPSLTAPQMQSAWAESLGINLLVANIHNPAGGFTGSGIYPGHTDLEHLYTYDSQGNRLVMMAVTSNSSKPDMNRGAPNPTLKSQEEYLLSSNNTDSELDLHGIVNDTGTTINGTKIHKERQIITYIETNVANNTISNISNADENEHKFKYEDLSIYSHFPLNQTIEGEYLTQSLCHNEEFCCNVTYTWPDRDSDIIYKLLAFDGLQAHAGGIYHTYYQVCSVLLCSSDDVVTCAHVENLIPQSNSLKVRNLEGLFEVPYVYPSVLNQDLTLAKRNLWNFDRKESNHNRWRIGVHVDKEDELQQLLALTLFGRIYERDP
ncbi:unnamed protein product [Meganyctiphanes norvegica]|uniref:CN hydrolase domain-containing protein n=1 Tax=Meganyctiphanes norvegica TaxID=48144 RepID=A0AAV2Q547_MEGNR